MMQPITDVPLLVVVGVTGVGKTTTVNALHDAGLLLNVLPNRRVLTDQLIIPEMQRDNDTAVHTVSDRAQRFALTRQYRQKYAGGMAHALAQLQVDNDPTLRLFDGLRGANEVAYAVTALPLAHFLVLDAPHAVRVQRLLGRHDAFDQIAAHDDDDDRSTAAGGTLDDMVAGVSALFADDERVQLEALVQSGAVSTADMAAKLAIVAKEAENYDPAVAIATLQAAAPERTILIDTTQMRPDEIAAMVINSLPS